AARGRRLPPGGDDDMSDAAITLGRARDASPTLVMRIHERGPGAARLALPRGGAGAASPTLVMGIDEVGSRAASIVQNVETVIAGKRDAITASLTVLLGEGPLLIEDVPGVGKTMLGKALARSVDCTVS